MDDSGTIGARLRQARNERGLTQEQLAERAGVSRDIIAKLEQEQRTTARITTLGRLANALGITLSALLDRRERLERAGQDGILAVRDALLSVADLPGIDPAADDGQATPLPELEAHRRTPGGGGVDPGADSPVPGLHQRSLAVRNLPPDRAAGAAPRRGGRAALVRHRPGPQGRLHQLADPVHLQSPRAVPAEDRHEQAGAGAGCHHGAGAAPVPGGAGALVPGAQPDPERVRVHRAGRAARCPRTTSPLPSLTW
jgi:transcriptional regulator with XRE-family HTH domain